MDFLRVLIHCASIESRARLGKGPLARGSHARFSGRLGSATWGAIAVHSGLGAALLWAGVGMVLSAAIGLFFRISDESVDLAPWEHWRLPVVPLDAKPGGPVLVTVEYQVHPDLASEFTRTMRVCGRVRRRDGASRWCLS